MSPRTAPRLVGRERELAATTDALYRGRDEGGRLPSIVTVAGPVGVGKSALAEVVAIEAGQGGPFDAVIRLDAAVPAPRAALRSALEAAPRSKRGKAATLIVLDGCDAAPDPAALVAAMLAEEPAASVLATSRTPLRVPGELVVELAPLATPTGDDPESPALDCLAAHLPAGASTALAAADRPAMAALLRELDGLPLALALAAPRLALMDARTLLHRLHRSRSVLDRPGTTAAERRPFEAALGSAMQALAPRARAALAALSSLAGPATLDTLEAIVGPPVASGDARAIDVVGELRERFLLLPARGPGEAGEAGETRLGMLRCVREVVRRTADPAVLNAGRDRHAAHFADLAEALQRRAAQGDAGATRAIRADRDELLLVLDRVASSETLSSVAAERALRVLVAVYAAVGALAPAAFLPIVDAAVDRTKDSGADPGLVAQALLVRARVRRAAGDAKGATRDLLRVLQVAAPARRRDIEADATIELARLFSDRGELVEAVDHARRSSIAYRESGDPLREATAAAFVGDLERRRGHLDEAREAIERALPLSTTMRGTPPRDVLLAALRLYLETSDEKALHARLATARAAAPDALQEEATFLLFEAVALHDRGEAVAARERYTMAAVAAREAALRGLDAEAALFDGIAALALGRRGEALALLRVAAEIDVEGVVASSVADLARATSFALDAWTTPTWRGAPPPARTRLARVLIAGAEAGQTFEAMRDGVLGDGDDRVFARLLVQALGGGAPPSTGDDDDVARFDVEGRWFRLPAEPTVSIERRKPLAAMLKLLVAERLARPGISVSTPRLLAAGWPGERVQADAGAHRVRVALSTLRKLGLRAVLLTTADGYTLDPSRKLTTATEGPA